MRANCNSVLCAVIGPIGSRGGCFRFKAFDRAWAGEGTQPTFIADRNNGFFPGNYVQESMAKPSISRPARSKFRPPGYTFGPNFSWDSGTARRGFLGQDQGAGLHEKWFLDGATDASPLCTSH